MEEEESLKKRERERNGEIDKYKNDIKMQKLKRIKF